MTAPTLTAYWQALDADTPGKQWWRAPHSHPAAARALRIDRAERGAVYALAPFRYARVAGRHLILAALPAPRIFEPVDADWLEIETVAAWDPVANTARALKGAFAVSDPLALFQRWAVARAQFAVRRQQARLKGRKPPPETLAVLAPEGFA